MQVDKDSGQEPSTQNLAGEHSSEQLSGDCCSSGCGIKAVEVSKEAECGTHHDGMQDQDSPGLSASADELGVAGTEHSHAAELLSQQN